MFFVFDENIPPKLPNLVKDIFTDNSNIDVHSVKDLRLLGTSDVDLFNKIKEFSNGKKCILISGDRYITRRPPEIQSLKVNGLIAFLCPPSVCEKPFQDRILYILNAWKGICEVASHSKERDIYLLPAKMGLTATEIKNHKK